MKLTTQCSEKYKIPALFLFDYADIEMHHDDYFQYIKHLCILSCSVTPSFHLQYII